MKYIYIYIKNTDSKRIELNLQFLTASEIDLTILKKG